MAAAVLTIDFNARLASLEQAVGRVEKSIGLIGLASQKASALSSTAFRSFAATLVAALGPTVVAASVKHVIDAMDELNDRAKKTQTSTEALSALGYAAKQSGIDAQGLDQLLTKLNASVLDAEAGGKKSAAAFAALGISTKSIDLSNPAETLTRLDDAFAHVSDGSVKAGLALTLLGKQGATALQFGGDLHQLTDEAKRFGLVISQETAAQADEFNDRLGRLKAASEGFRNQVVANMLPSLNAFAGAFLDDAKQSDGLRASIVRLTSDNALFGFLEGAITLIAKMADGFVSAGNVVKSFVAQGQKGISYAQELHDVALEGFQSGIANSEGITQSTDELKAQADRLSAIRQRYGAQRAAIDEAAVEDLGKEGRYSDAAAKIIENARKRLNEAATPKKGGRSQQSTLDDFIRNGGGSQAAAKKDPFDAYVSGLSAEDVKQKFDITNFDRFKGAAETSKRAVVEFELELGKFSDQARAQAGLPALTKAQKDHALAVADSISKQAEQLTQLKALSSFDDTVKRIKVDATLVGEDSVVRESTIRLLDLEKAGVDKSTAAYQQRAAAIREALTVERQANENQAVKSFDFQSRQAANDAQFQISLLGRSRAAVEDLTAARQVDLEVIRQTTDATGKVNVTDDTLAQYRALGERIKQQTVETNQQRRVVETSALTGARDFFNAYVDTANDAASQMKSVLGDLFSGAEDALVDFAKTGHLSIAKLAEDLGTNLLRISFKNIASNLAQQISGAFGGGQLGSGGATGGLFGSLIGAVTGSTTGGSGGAAGAAAGAVGAAGSVASVASTASTTAANTALSSLAVTVAANETSFTGLAVTTTTVDTALIALSTSASSAATALASIAASSAASSGGSALGAIGSAALASSKGNVFAGGTVIPFQRGGVVQRESFFSMRNGRMGSMAEGGKAEAIMPLVRASNGDLAVRNVGGGGRAGSTFHLYYQPTPGESRESVTQRGEALMRGAQRAAARNG